MLLLAAMNGGFSYQLSVDFIIMRRLHVSVIFLAGPVRRKLTNVSPLCVTFQNGEGRFG